MRPLRVASAKVSPATPHADIAVYVPWRAVEPDRPHTVLSDVLRSGEGLFVRGAVEQDDELLAAYRATVSMSRTPAAVPRPERPGARRRAAWPYWVVHGLEVVDVQT